MNDNEMWIGNAMKLKLRASVEWVEKMDLPVEDHGYYAILDINGSDIYSWKLNKLEQMMVFNERQAFWSNTTEEDRRISRNVDKNGLEEFIAGKIGEVFEYVLRIKEQGC